MSKKNFLARKIVVVLLFTAAIITIDVTQKDKVKKPDTPVVLSTYIAHAYIGKMDGWFTDLLKEKLNVEIQCEHYGAEDENHENADLYDFFGRLSYYDEVKAGKLKNLEKEVKKRPDVYAKYASAIHQIREDTYNHTGKKGIYGLPLRLTSFEDVGSEGHCICIPSGAKNPEKAMELITYSASEEGIMNIAFGPEGQMWKKEHGNYVLLQDWRQIEDEHPGKKFVETKHGKEDFYEAICKMELVGNFSLAQELIGEKNDE